MIEISVSHIAEIIQAFIFLAVCAGIFSFLLSPVLMGLSFILGLFFGPRKK